MDLLNHQKKDKKNCISDAVLLALHQGKLADENLAGVEAHLESCLVCSNRLELLWENLENATGGQVDPDSSQVWVRQILESGSPARQSYLKPAIVKGDLGRLGKYRVLEKLGEGSSSVVYRAMDKALLRPVTLKVFRPDYSSGDEGRRELVNEARIVARFTNHLVVGLIDFCRDGMVSYLVLPDIHGLSLEKVLEEKKAEKLDRQDTFLMALDIVNGLAEIHQIGLLHRDLKPANILVHMDENGKRHCQLIDLGLTSSQSTRAGTAGFRAPELTQAGIHSVATDLFSLGVVLSRLSNLSKKPWPKGLLRLLQGLQSENPLARPCLLETKSKLQQVKRFKYCNYIILIGSGLVMAGALAGQLLVHFLWK
jgi:serine/threonine protein kinase